MSKNPPEFYGVAYLKSPLAGGEGINRWQDNGVYHNGACFAAAIARHVGAQSILDVGCGRGFVVRHLRNLGVTADGCEYGVEAVQHSVCGAVFGDLTDRLPYADKSYDLAHCVGVLSQFPAEDAPQAISELARVARGWLLTNILVKYHEAAPHHLNVSPPDWWRERFDRAGFRQVEIAELCGRFGMARNPLSWLAFWEKR